MTTRSDGLVALKRCCRDSEGSSLLEFAIATSTVLTAVLGVVGGTLALYTYHYVANAAREGARYAMVRGSSWKVPCASPSAYGCTATGDSVKAYLLAMAPMGMSAANTTVLAAWPGTSAAGTGCYTVAGTNGIGCSVSVTVSYTFQLVLPLLPKKTLQFSSTSIMPITQ